MALQASATIKLEASVEPFPSTTVNPMEMMTPQPSNDDLRSTPLSTVAEEDENNTGTDGAEVTDKKPTKKRKSWGQVLPEPKTNLPPRKRAKTDDEKEQRRVERVLRNRRAAQSSRERKRLEVEALEKRNKELENLLLNAQKANLMLVEELNRFRRDSGVVTCSSSPLDTLRDNPITLSQQLFGSQDEPKSITEPSSLMGDLMSNPTVNPASLSPELAPVSDTTPATAPASTEAQSGPSMAISDLTQRPAEMLCDLPCHMSEVNPLLPVSLTPLSPLLAWTLQLRMLLLSASAILSVCQRPLMQIAMSSKAGFSLLPTPQLLTTIIWLVTLSPASTSTSSTSTTSSTMRQIMSPQTLWQRAMTPLRTTASSRKSTTLRFKSLRKILSSSPNLARPLMDATMEALRLVSKGCDDRIVDCGESCATREAHSDLAQCLRGISLPSPEVLLTLLWALKLHEQRRRSKNQSQARQGPGYGILTEPTRKFVLKIRKESHSGRHVGKNASERYRLT